MCATFPWVNYHREPIVQYLTRHCPISDAGQLYFAETTGRTLDMCDELQKGRNFGLYVMHHPTLPDKGFESWTDQPSEVDTTFTVVCIARATAEPTTSSAAQTVAATARAIVYNANPQVPHDKRIDLRTKRIIPIYQPQTGWDTLQWMPGEVGKMPFELIGKGSLLRPSFPHTRVSWKAKLVPVEVANSQRSAVASSNPTGESGLPSDSPLEVKFLKSFSSLATH